MPVIVLLAALYTLYIVQKHVYKRFWNKNLFFDFTASSFSAFEGDSITVSVNAANMKFLPLPWVNISFVVPHQIAFLDASSRQVSYGEEKNITLGIPMKKSIGRKHTAICQKRGYYRIGGFEISSRDYLLNQALRMPSDLTKTITVYPKLIEIDPQIIPYKQLSGDVLAKRFIDPDPFEFKSIREYQYYDSFKQINFKATARTGEIMSNVYDFTVSREISIFLNTENYSSYYRDYVHEQAIRLAASLAEYFISSGIPVSICSSGVDIVSGKSSYLSSGLSQEHLSAVYELLARINLNRPVSMDDSILNEYIDSIFENTQNTMYVLISSNHKDSILDIYNSLMGNILWIIPMTAYDIDNASNLPQGDSIIIWEVEDE